MVDVLAAVERRERDVATRLLAAHPLRDEDADAGRLHVDALVARRHRRREPRLLTGTDCREHHDQRAEQRDDDPTTPHPPASHAQDCGPDRGVELPGAGRPAVDRRHSPALVARALGQDGIEVERGVVDNHAVEETEGLR